MLLDEITMEEFSRGLSGTKTLIVPYGTVEAHGTHLPLGTDTLIIREVVKAVAERRPVFVAPPLHYGVCTSTGQHAGTIGITPSTLRRITGDLVRDGYGRGLRNFVLISGHAGGQHISAMKEAAEALTTELPEVTIASLSLYEVLPREELDLSRAKNDSHAGDFETSLVLYLAKDLVKGRAKEEYPKLPSPIIARDKLKFWPGAVWGNPAMADEAKGEKLFKLLVEKVVELIERVEGFGE